MIDKIKNILGIGKKADTSTKEVEVPASKVGPKTYVIIGASAAAVDAIKTLRKLDKSVNIIVISKDENIYSRCMLHHVISEHRTVEGINFVDADFMEKNDATWIKKATVTSIDTENKAVKYEKDGKTEEQKYDKLLIASGANAAIPPIKNIREGKNIYPLRNIEDAIAIREKAKHCKKVAIIGGGLVGIDALSGLLEIDGIEEISIMMMENRILDKQLDEKAASVYADKFKAKGVNIITSCNIGEVFLDEEGNVSGVNVNGEKLDCELLIVSTGVKPNIALIEGSGIEAGRGIIINDKCETNVKDVYAAGDVTGTGIWPLATKQGVVAASNMAGVEKFLTDRFEFKNTMNFMGIPTVSLGFTTPADDSYDVVTYEYGDTYKKAVIKDDVLTGFIVQGDISYAGPYAQLVKNKVKVENLAEKVFDLGYSDFFSIKEDGQFEWNV